jgi:hypothetical protein
MQTNARVARICICAFACLLGGPLTLMPHAMGQPWGNVFSGIERPEGVTYKDGSMGFQITIPGSWLEADSKTIMRANIDSKFSKNVFDAGFQFNYPPADLHDKPKWGHPWENARNGEAYILIQRTFYSGMLTPSYDELKSNWFAETGLIDISDAEGDLADLTAKLGPGRAVFDQSRNLLIMEMPGKYGMQNVSYAFLSKTGMVLIHCHASYGEFHLFLPKFNAIAATAQISEEEKFIPGYGPPFGVPWHITMGAAALILVVLACMIYSAVRMKKPAPPKTSPSDPSSYDDQRS